MTITEQATAQPLDKYSVGQLLDGLARRVVRGGLTPDELERAAALIAAAATPTPAGFGWIGRYLDRIECLVCHQRGLPGGPWMGAHRRGHLPCPVCGHVLTVYPDGTARRHGTCPATPAP